MQFYSNPAREQDPHASPDCETFTVLDGESLRLSPHARELSPIPGYYWWSCPPGCLPDGEPHGPFGTEALAIADCREVGVA